MKFLFEEWTDREKWLKRQNEGETGGEGLGLGCFLRKDERGAVCIREREFCRAGGQVMGVQLKVHTLAKIWVLSRQSSCRPLQGTHHTPAACLKMWWAPLTDALLQSKKYCSSLLSLSEPLTPWFSPSLSFPLSLSHQCLCSKVLSSFRSVQSCRITANKFTSFQFSKLILSEVFPWYHLNVSKRSDFDV